MKKFLSLPFIQSIVCASSLLIINWNILVSSLSARIPLGNDSVGHLEVGQYYAQHIFPKTWGWIPHLFGGMPFPQFYPPFFYFLTALVYKITPFTYLQVFEWLIVVLTLSVPCLIAVIARRVNPSAFSGWFAGMISVCLLSIYYEHFNNLGITIQGTYGVGLVTQLLGFVCLLAWLYFFLDPSHSKKSMHGSVFFLTLTVLSNAHIVPVAALVFTTHFFVGLWFNRKTSLQEKKDFLKNYVFLGGMPLALSLFWYAPMLHLFPFMAGRSLGYAAGFDVLFLRGLFSLVFIVCALPIVIRKKNQPVITLMVSISSIFILTFSRINELFPGFPIHTLRLLGPAFLLAPLITDYVISSIIAVIKGYPNRGFTILIFSLLIVLALTPYAYLKRISGSYTETTFNEEHIDTLQAYMKKNAGNNSMVNVEVGNNGRALNYFMTSLTPTPFISSDYSVIAESSMSSLFMIPLRSSLSEQPEVLPVDSFLPQYYNNMFPAVDAQTTDKKIQQAHFLGIDHFFVRSTNQINKFASSSLVSLEQDFGIWKLFKTVDKSLKAEVVAYQPVVLFSEVNFKKRNTDAYDYLAFQEALFAQASFDVVIADAHDHMLDTSADLDQFPMAIISQYDYKDKDKAIARLQSYAQDHMLILISREDPVFEALEQTNNPNIHIFKRQQAAHPTTELDASVVESLQTIIHFLDDHKIPVRNMKATTVRPATIKTASFLQNSISITADNPAQTPVPLLIKSSYFPTWQLKNSSEKPYLATPTYMLVYATSTVNLVFDTDWAVYLGSMVSMLGLLYWIYTIVSTRFSKGGTNQSN